MLRLCVALFSSVLALSSLAAPQVFVVGLFPGAAVLNVDGQRKLVRVGQTGPQGVQVVSADSRKAVLRIDGEASNARIRGMTGFDSSLT